MVQERDRAKVYVDVETTGLDARKDKLRIVAIDGRAYDVWDYQQWYEAAHRLRKASEEGYTFVAHNAQFDLDFLYENISGLEPWGGPIYDTMVAFQLLTAGRRIPASLGSVAKTLLGVELDKSFQKYRWDGTLDEQMLEYAAKDTEILEPLVRELSAGLRRTDLVGIFNLEMALLPALLASRRKGIRLDREGALRLISRLSEEARELESKLPMLQDSVREQDTAGALSLFEGAEFVQVPERRMNPRAPQDVSNYFNLPDATEDTLREYIKRTGDEHAKVVRDIKKKYKKASTIQKQLLDRVGADGRIHPWFNQTFVETGRLSSREPNLQNQDRGSDVRGLFIPGDGARFVIADYSQLELRLAAYFSRDETMLNAYRSGRDLHTETQLQIFGDPKTMGKDEAKRARTLSKNINFGLIYGGGHGVLIRFAAKSDVEISEEEAIRYRNAFRELYPGLVKWQERTGNTKPEFVRTYRGRRRYITPGEGYCTRINNIVQGSAADGMKLAMVELYRQGILPLLNVHDEVVIECDAKDADEILANVEKYMVSAMYRAVGMDEWNPVVPIEVEAEIANSWAEKG